MKAKKSSIEWLRKKLLKDFGIAFSDNIFEQAKEMHKKEIVDAYYGELYYESSSNGEHYYNKTFVAQK